MIASPAAVAAPSARATSLGLGATLPRVFALVLLAAACAAVPSLRVRALHAAGAVLVVDAPPQPADAIVASVAAGRGAALDVADLIAGGYARRVAVLADPPQPADAEFARRGIAQMDEADALVATLRALGVTRVEKVAYTVAGTEEFAEVLPRWAAAAGVHSVIVVTTPDHSRRMTRVMRRAADGRGVRVSVRSSRYAPFDPRSWWRSRTAIRIYVVEVQKLALDVIRHPLS